MKNTMKRFLTLMLVLAMVLSCVPVYGFAAETGNVAKVGNTEYATIDEAIAAWTNNTTLTLLADVTLSDVIKLSSTEYHILDLGTYTMTAASGKDAIQYVVNGRTSAGYALDIKADATNPGGITATGKTIVSHIKPSSGAPGKDRPMTRFYGGIFNASYVVKQGGSWGAGYTGASAPYFQFYGGEYNGTIYTNRSQNQFYGGTFNGSMQMSVDSSAYTLIAGGTFKNLSNSMGSALNSDKFTIGSKKGANDGSVCVDENGNYVITTTTPAEAEASVASNYNSNNYFYYSTVNTNGMYYEDVYDALEANQTATVTVYTDEVDLTDSSFKGTIVVPEGEEITIVVPDDETPAWTIKSAVENEEPKVAYKDESGNELVKKEDGSFEVIVYAAQIGNTKYEIFADAVAAAKHGDTVTLLSDLNIDSETYTIADGTSITLDMNDKKITVTDNKESGNYELFYIYGGMKVTGNGTIELTANYDRDWNAMSAIFHNRGGVLTIENGTFKHLGGTDMAYVVDNSGNYYGDATTNIMDGTLSSSYIAIRNRMEQNSHGASGTAYLNVSGGTISGTSRAIWAQAASTSTTAPATGEINISGGEIGLIDTPRSAGAVSMTTITGGTVAAFKGEVGELTVKDDGEITGEITLMNADGTDAFVNAPGDDGVYDDVVVDAVAKVGDTYFATFADAVKSVPKNTEATITLLRNAQTSVMVGHQYVQKITVDLNGYTLSTNGIVLTAYRSGTVLTVKNGTIKGNASTGSLRATYGGKIVLGENLTIAGAGGSAALTYTDNGSIEISAAAKDGVKFVGGNANLDFKQSTNVNNKLSVGASIGRTYFATMADAMAAVKDGETIVLLNDINLDADDMGVLDGYHTFFKIEGKSITIDLNGKTIYADASTVTDKFVVGVFSATNGGKLTLKDSSENGTGTVQGYSGETQEAAYLVDSKGNTDYNYKFYSLLVVYDDNCSITVEGGNYILDYAGDSLAYTSCNEGIVVNGGTFKLGNLGGIRNGMPWVFNARGQNIRHVVVNGGSFCADIQHQYYPFEVSMPKDKALKNENGMYTVVDAVAYVTEREWSSAWYTNEVGYATLEEAIAACEGPKTKSKKTSEQEVVVLLENVELTDSVTVAAGKSVILDLNGKTISQTKTCTESYEMIGNNGSLTINDSVGTGKITLTDNGAGDPNFGWGSYTVRNSGTLVVNGGTIEFVGAQAFGTHCGLAIFQYSGSSTINGGSVINNAYRSIRLWHGDVTINNGTFEGQVWVHCVDDSAVLNINGGSFAPATSGDASSVFVNNSGYTAKLSITGGYFATKVGANDVNALAGCITGGEFSEAALNDTNSVLFAK